MRKYGTPSSPGQMVATHQVKLVEARHTTPSYVKHTRYVKRVCEGLVESATQLKGSDTGCGGGKHSWKVSLDHSLEEEKGEIGALEMGKNRCCLELTQKQL